MKLIVFNRTQFENAISVVTLPKSASVDFIYDIYLECSDAINDLLESRILPESTFFSPSDLIFYILGEYLYSIATRSEEEIKNFNNNEKIKSSMMSVSVDKFIGLTVVPFKEKKIINKYLPTASSLSLYLSVISNVLSTYERNNPKTTLINDLLSKSISLTSCILELLISGYESEAFASWRTLHECECTLLILEKHGDVVIESYLKHMKYGIAFKDGFNDKEQQDKIFEEIKNGMKQFDLKSKDMKKYIEYGWLYALEEVKNDETFKLNFRDGLEKVAGLSKYSKIYEKSSEIIHSTPMLFYANKQYYYFITLLNLYESFFRLEKIFVSLISKHIPEEEKAKYRAMRDAYFTQLVNIHKREAKNFEAWQKKHSFNLDF